MIRYVMSVMDVMDVMEVMEVTDVTDIIKWKKCDGMWRKWRNVTECDGFFNILVSLDSEWWIFVYISIVMSFVMYVQLIFYTFSRNKAIVSIHFSAWQTACDRKPFLLRQLQSSQENTFIINFLETMIKMKGW